MKATMMKATMLKPAMLVPSVLNSTMLQFKKTSATVRVCLPLMLMLLMLLQACSGGSGGGATERDASVVIDTGTETGFTYSGPTAVNIEIQSFKREFYDNLAIAGRCGDCHTTGGPGPNLFVDKDDVNNAWQEANKVVNLDDPASSEVVQRVTNGHNCWLGSDQTASCRTAMIGYINNWAASSGGEATTVKLLPRASVDASGTKPFPQNAPVDFTKVGGLHNLLTEYCSDCHSPDADIPQSPYFASADVEQAYQAVQSKINLITVADSRLVVRLRQESHQCWTDNCADDANELETAISDIANAIAKNASESSFDFIINQIDSLGDKSSIAMNSMENITQEKLVPKLQQIINSRDPNSELSQVSLTTLANMGQYEAAVALIQWSAYQPPSADKLVTELFNSAVNSSPSAYRAIEKELNSYDFLSSEIKKTIQTIYSAR